MSFIEINSVTKRYSSHTALDQVSMNIPERSIFGLLGPNGAGKTSLIRIINQITGPDSGEIRFQGQHLGPEHVSKIGYLPEERGLYKKMEVGEQTLYLAMLKGMSRSDASKRLKYWFEKFEMQSWWKKKVGDLSKGMQQKVQFIVTIVHEPTLLILDEPFTGFDPINANLIRDELMDLNKKGTTIMLSTHRMETVEALCSHIALINKSKKILDGKVSDIRNSFRTRILRIEYRGHAIALANSLWDGFELLENKTEDGLSTAMVKIPEGKIPNDLLKGLISEVQVESLSEMVPGMGDIFISAVEKNSAI